MACDQHVVKDAGIRGAGRIIDQALCGSGSRPMVASFFDQPTVNVSHALHCPSTRSAMIVDPVLDYGAPSGRISHVSLDRLVDHVREHELRVVWVLDTHVHTDHLSGAAALRARLSAQTGMSRPVLDVQDRFTTLFDLGERRPDLPSAFDHLFDDGDAFRLGEVECMSPHVPGHTQADMAYVVGDTMLTGDTLFMPDFGIARADFPGGDPAQLYASVRRLLTLPPETRLLHCHDYPPSSRKDPARTSTVAMQRAGNVHVRDGVDEASFVAMRSTRDATLSTPTLMMASVQVNVRGGELPAPAGNGRRYLKLPLDSF